MRKKRLKCLIVASEVAPYAKTGGLADVTYALPKGLRKEDVDVRVVMPYYSLIKTKFTKDKHKRMTQFNVCLNWRNQKAKIWYDEKNVPTYFVENAYYFDREELYGYDDDAERFAFFCKATLELLRYIDFVPDIIHCNDWQTGPICLLLKEKYQTQQLYKDIKTVFTIHNMKYQGVFGRTQVQDVLELGDEYFTADRLEFYGGMSYMKAGLLYSDRINTVSPTYAEEIKTWEYGCNLNILLSDHLSDKLSGILNGIDYDLYNPMTDSHIYQPYSIDSLVLKKQNKLAFQKEYGLEKKDCMMVGVISRLTDQKGFDLFKQTYENEWLMDRMMEMDIQFVLLGTGEREYEDMFKHFSDKYGKRAGIFLSFNEALAQKIYAACDAFLMPSAFEPCGLSQLMSMRYGTVPIVRKTGGLKDTVTHYNYETKEGTGFEFEEYTGAWMLKKIEACYECYTKYPKDFEQIQKNGMQKPFSWVDASKKYIELYDLACT